MTDLYTPDYVQVTIEGTDRTEYVIAYERKSSICELGDSFTLEMSPEYPTTIDPYDSIVIKERYGDSPAKVLQGYIVEVTQAEEPGSYLLSGGDKSVLLFDYFIYEQLDSNGESVNYWMNYLAGLAGLSMTFEASSPAIVEKDTPLGFQTIGDAMLMLERLGAYYVKYDSVSDSLVAFRLSTSEPQTTVDEALAAERHLSTDKTRNVVKVYGGFRYNLETSTNDQVFATARTDILELISDKTVVVSNASLNRQTFASIVASRILNVVNSIDDIQIYAIEGLHQTLQVGDVANIIWNRDWNYEGSRVITSIHVTVDHDGAVTRLTFGEKCPRLSITLPPTPVFVSTISGGVGVSWNGGDSFVPTNAGLSGAALDVTSIAVNSYGQSMVTTQSGIYKRPSFVGTWTKVTNMPDPVNTEGAANPPSFTDLGLKRMTDAPTRYGHFYVLASGFVLKSGNPFPQSRGWVYSTHNFGITWSSMQLFMPPSGWPSIPASGLNWGIIPMDISTSLDNNSYVLIKSSETVIIDKTLVDIYWIYQVSQGRIVGGVWDGNDVSTLPLFAVTGNSNKIFTYHVWSVPLDRTIAYLAVVHNDINETDYHKGICSVWRTNDGGSTWDLIHQQPFFDSYDGFDDRYAKYAIFFDPDSTSTSVRIVFAGYDNLFTAGVTEFYIHTRLVTDNPTTESTNYSDLSSLKSVSNDDWNMYLPVYENIDKKYYVDSKQAVDYNGYCYSSIGFWTAGEGNNEDYMSSVLKISFSTGSATFLYNTEIYSTDAGQITNPSKVIAVRGGNVYTVSKGGIYENDSQLFSPQIAYGLGLPGLSTADPLLWGASISNLKVFYANGSSSVVPLVAPLPTDFSLYIDNTYWTEYPEAENNSYDYVYIEGDFIDREGGLYKTINFIDFTAIFNELYREPATGYGGYGLDDWDYRTFED